MSTSVTEHSARFPLPTMLVRGRANTLTLTIESAGSGITPASGTVTVRDSSGAAVVDGAAITAANPSTYAIIAATIPATTALDDSWLVEWAITFTGGEAAEFATVAYVVRRDLHPVITVSDLTQKDPTVAAANFIASGETLQAYMDEAFERIQRWLISRGRRPSLILDPFALWDLHIAETLVDLYRQAATALNSTGRLGDAYDLWRAEAERLRGSLSLRYDVDEDGIPNDERRSASPPLFLTSGPR